MSDKEGKRWVQVTADTFGAMMEGLREGRECTECNCWTPKSQDEDECQGECSRAAIERALELALPIEARLREEATKVSKQRGCVILELEPGQWSAVVARDEYDYAFKDATIYGPKPTWEEALELMDRYEANPGSFSTVEAAQVSEDQRELAKRATRPRRSRFTGAY